MVAVDNEKVKKLIRDLLLVLTLGALSAGGLSLAVLYFFSPSGTYKTEHILLSPENAFRLSYKEINPQTRKSVSYVFDGVELQWFDIKEGRMKERMWDQQRYEKFYAQISGDRSLNSVPPSIERLFNSENPVRVIINVKEPNSSAVTLFQELQILNLGHYYRIQLRQESRKKEWVYFFHENIYGALNGPL